MRTRTHAHTEGEGKGQQKERSARLRAQEHDLLDFQDGRRTLRNRQLVGVALPGQQPTRKWLQTTTVAMQVFPSVPQEASNQLTPYLWAHETESSSPASADF